ncbi:MAG TPA: PPC domain-containing protein [Kofleriaceae bacterium]|jgi:hypothetical protein
MVRESPLRAACALAPAWLIVISGCSLALDFSDKEIPIDAAADGPFAAADCTFGEPNDTPDQPFAVTAGMTGPAAICPPAIGSDGSAGADDLDYYGFSVPDGTTSVTVTIVMSDRANGDLDLKLFGSDGVTQLGQSRGITDTETITCPGASPSCAPLTTGNYVFEVFPAITGQTNSYNITLTIDGSGSGSDDGSGSGSGSG